MNVPRIRTATRRMSVAAVQRAAMVVKAIRALTPANFGLLLTLACVMLAAEAVVSFPLWFAPGWANGWPGGLTIHQVWSTCFTIMLFIMLITVGVGLGSAISLVVCIFTRGRGQAGSVFGVWIVIWTIISAAVCFLAFKWMYASTLEMWPGGYPR
jgi:hypothetical protein